MIKKLDIKNIKINSKTISNAIDYKKLVYPPGLYTIKDEKSKINHKKEYFRKICSKYEINEDNKLIYIGNSPENYKKNFRIPFEFEKESILSKTHSSTGHASYHRLYNAIKDTGIFWDSLTNDCKEFVNNCPTCIKLRNHKSLKPKILIIKTKGPKIRYVVDGWKLHKIIASRSGFSWVIDLVDHFSKFMWSYAITNNIAKNILIILKN